jgi:acetyl-CoA acetyltransferase
MNGRKVAIVGVGYSEVGRGTGLTDRHHVAQAAKAAMEDAGLTRGDIDGMVTLGGEVMDYAHMLGETPLRYQLNCDNAAPAFIAPATQAAMAVAAGQADVCMAFRVMMQQPSSTNADLIAYLMQKATPNTADAEFTQPFGSFSPTQWAGIHMNRYLHESDATEEHFSIFASIQREYAERNPNALQRTQLTP